MDPWFGLIFLPIFLSTIAYSILFIIFGILDLIFCITCLSRRGNPAPHWGGLLVVGIISIITGFGIGILVIVAAVLAEQSGGRRQTQTRRVTRQTRRPTQQRTRIYRRERLGRSQHFDQQIVKYMQAAQKSFKAKRWRTVVKHAWTATEALLNKLYEINFDETPPPSLSTKEIIQRLTIHLPRGKQTAAAITEVYMIRSKVKPKSAPVKQEDAEKVLAAAHQLCFWFNIRLEVDTETTQTVAPKVETVPEGLCGVCNLRHRPGQRILTTPCCKSICHYACLSEWVKVKQVCPLCRKKLQFRSGEVRLRR